MKTILVVDDSSSVRQQLRLVLDRVANVIEAFDGVQALQLLERRTVNLIISDINLPRLNGLELLERLRFRSTPFLLLTIERQAELLDRARRAGATGWIIKPFKAELLMKAAVALIEGR